MGEKWNVWSMAIKADGTTFDPPKVAAPLPAGEIAISIASYLGYVLVGSSRGWRFGTADTAGALSLGRLISTDAPVRCFEGQDRFVWYGQDATGTLSARLGRTDLSVFTSALTPAATNDLDSGQFPPGGQVRGVASFGATGLGRRVFTVDNVGVFAEDTNLVTSGYLEQGDMAFHSTDFKQGLYAQLFHEPLGSGRITVDVSYDDGPWVTIGQTDGGGASAMGNMPTLHDFYQANLRYTLEPSSTALDVSPALTRAELRVLPLSGRATQWRLPLLLHETLDFDGNQYDRDVRADKQFLLDLVRSKEPFSYREGNDYYTLFAVDFTFLPRKVSSGVASFEGTFSITCQEIG
jgi:hypothetical protein